MVVFWPPFSAISTYHAIKRQLFSLPSTYASMFVLRALLLFWAINSRFALSSLMRWLAYEWYDRWEPSGRRTIQSAQKWTQTCTSNAFDRSSKTWQLKRKAMRRSTPSTSATGLKVLILVHCITMHITQCILRVQIVPLYSHAHFVGYNRIQPSICVDDHNEFWLQTPINHRAPPHRICGITI